MGVCDATQGATVRAKQGVGIPFVIEYAFLATNG
jgi:hypothetical protein